MSSSKKRFVCLTIIWLTLFEKQQILTDVSPDVNRLLVRHFPTPVAVTEPFRLSSVFSGQAVIAFIVYRAVLGTSVAKITIGSETAHSLASNGVMSNFRAASSPFFIDENHHNRTDWV